MSKASTENMKTREENLCNEEWCEFAQAINKVGGQRARAMALQQLAVSDDSPFNLTSAVAPSDNLRSGKPQVSPEDEEKARQLREETDKIKQQLELVKRHLSEFNLVGGNCLQACRHGGAAGKSDESACHPAHGPTSASREPDAVPNEQVLATASNTRRPCQEFAQDQQITSADSQFKRNATDALNELCSRPAPKPIHNKEFGPLDDSARLRPLTGKTDCPNCACDRRRSVCDKCINLQKDVVQQTSDQQQQEPPTKSTIEQADAERSRQATLLTEQRLDKLNEQRSDGPCRKQQQQQNLRNYDERPIRPATKRFEDLLSETEAHPKAADKAEPKTLDQNVVPNKLFTIGRSLNDKRTKLAQAIEDLQIMIDKVKKRGDRLEQERKVASLYRDQWKFGPRVGGGSRSGSRESLAGGQYQSRLDANLARDSKAMMGFKHIEPALRLRQYDNGRQPQPLARSRPALASTPPRPKPRLSKMNSGSNNYRRATEASMLHSRSKSLESLPGPRSVAASNPVRQAPRRPPTAAGPGLAGKKSTSERNLNATISAPSKIDGNESDQGVEEDLEEEFREADPELSASSDESESGGRPSRENAEKRPTPNSPIDYSELEVAGRRNMSPSVAPPKKLGGWVPVFGETEIKTINRRAPERKVIIMNSSGGFNASASDQAPSPKSTVGRSILRNETGIRARSVTRNSRNDPVLNEAKKKLQFANNLLEREQVDSRTRNQLVVSRQQRGAPAARAKALAERPSRASGLGPPRMISRQASELSYGQQQRLHQRPAVCQPSNSLPVSDRAQGLMMGANKEISRLEEMISEQQRLLLRLTAVSSGAAPTCCQLHASSSSCRSTPSPTHHSQTSAKTGHHQANRQLISQLRERLNKTKARLAKTLEEERAKHQQLEQRFDSSLRKQSDLENENELLKQSLSKCIDTCLRDISSTFETLSDQLSESFAGLDGTNSAEAVGAASSAEASGENPVLANAARLISDNTHLKRMKTHIDTIERQRRGIFDELNQERHKSQQLELELKQSKLELDQLIEAKRRLEVQLAGNESDCAVNSSRQLEEAAKTDQSQTSASVPTTTVTFAEASTSKQTTSKTVDHTSSDQPVSDSSATEDPTTTSMSFSSIDLYRQYIQTMTPDLDAIRRERRMILSEFDNIKRMLSDMEA